MGITAECASAYWVYNSALFIPYSGTYSYISNGEYLLYVSDVTVGVWTNVSILCEPVVAHTVMQSHVKHSPCMCFSVNALLKEMVCASGGWVEHKHGTPTL